MVGAMLKMLWMGWCRGLRVTESVLRREPGEAELVSIKLM
jgi:hypothetical protein